MDMESIRKVLRSMGYSILADPDSGFGVKLKAAFLAAQPPGVDEIYVALHELDAAMPDCAMHHITLYGTGNSGIHSGRARERGSDIKAEDIPAAIRALIPEPEPTVGEDLDIIGQRLHYFDGDDCPCPARAPTYEALARLRERLEEKGKS